MQSRVYVETRSRIPFRNSDPSLNWFYKNSVIGILTEDFNMQFVCNFLLLVSADGTSQLTFYIRLVNLLRTRNFLNHVRRLTFNMSRKTLFSRVTFGGIDPIGSNTPRTPTRYPEGP